MQNLFGRIYLEKPFELLTKIFPQKSLFEFIETSKYTNNPTEIAKEVLRFMRKKIMNKQSFYPFNRYKNTSLVTAFESDLIFLMVMSFLYEQIRSDTYFSEESSFIKAFNKKLNFTVRRKAVHKNNGNNYILRQFLPTESTRPKLFKSVIDIGLVLSLYKSAFKTANPFISDKSEDKDSYGLGYNRSTSSFSANAFLQTFQYTYFGKENIEKLYDRLLDDNITNSEIPSDTGNKAYVKEFKSSICTEAYSLLNQFLIERIANMNYICALYHKLKSNSRIANDNADAFRCWTGIPLLRTRLYLVEKFGEEKPLPESGDSKGPIIHASNNISDNIVLKPEPTTATSQLGIMLNSYRYLNTYFIPIVLTLYHHVMRQRGLKIEKDFTYFRNVCKKGLYNFYMKDHGQDTEDENNAKENNKTAVTNGTIIPAHKDYKNYIEQREFNMLAKILLSDFDALTTIPNNNLKEHLDSLDRLFKEVRIYSLLHPEILSELQEKLNVFAGKITLTQNFHGKSLS